MRPCSPQYLLDRTISVLQNFHSISPTRFLPALCSLALLTLTSCGGGGGGSSEDNAVNLPTNFLSENTNLNIRVQNVKIPPNGRPSVEFTLRDDNDSPITLDEITQINFILAVLERTSVGAPFEYRSYSIQIEDPDGIPNSGDEAIQAAHDPAGIEGLTQANDGIYTFQFVTQLPDDYNRSATHQLGAEISRYSSADDRTYIANLAMPFRPDAFAVVHTREMVSIESCNTCHTQLSVDHGLRREIQLCILCHSTHSTDAETGNSLNFSELIHKLHRGQDLQSLIIDGEPYQIHGIENKLTDYSTVKYPQPIQNCATCHSGAPGASQFERAPTAVGCQSCHDRVWYGIPETKPASFNLHPGGVQPNNSKCAECHSPLGNGVAPVDLVHILPQDTFAAKGLNLELLSVDTFPGAFDTGVEIMFTAHDADGNPITDLADIDRVGATIAWPIIEYEQTIHETVSSSNQPSDGTLLNLEDGSYSYTFAAELPATPDNTFSISLEGNRSYSFRGRPNIQGAQQKAPVVFSTSDPTDTLSRRAIVLDQKCNVCHDELRAHDNLRVGIDSCIMCHNPNATDELTRPASQFPPESINFKDMIHRIHTGTDLEQPYTVFGSGGHEHDFTQTRFSGDLRDCTMCHIDGSQTLPIPDEALSTLITENSGATMISETFPETAACTSCHTSAENIEHALEHADITTGAESCSTCHGESGVLSVTDVHFFDRFNTN
jgi:OmcA/MtrC family decaheme c-type cytochrome